MRLQGCPGRSGRLPVVAQPETDFRHTRPVFRQRSDLPPRSRPALGQQPIALTVLKSSLLMAVVVRPTC